MEDWIEIPGFPNYMVSDHGRVKNVKFDKILKPSMVKSGLSVKLYEDHRSHVKLVARLVAEGFSTEVMNSSMVVRHIDKDRSNNHIDNLLVEYRGTIIHERIIDHLGNVIAEY